MTSDWSGVPTAVNDDTTKGFVLALDASNASTWANAGDTLIVKTAGAAETDTVYADNLTVNALSGSDGLDLVFGAGVSKLTLIGSAQVDGPVRPMPTSLLAIGPPTRSAAAPAVSRRQAE